MSAKYWSIKEGQKKTISVSLNLCARVMRGSNKSQNLLVFMALLHRSENGAMKFKKALALYSPMKHSLHFYTIMYCTLNYIIFHFSMEFSGENINKLRQRNHKYWIFLLKKIEAQLPTKLLVVLIYYVFLTFLIPVSSSSTLNKESYGPFGYFFACSTHSHQISVETFLKGIHIKFTY